MRPIVILGAGQGGTSTAESLRDRGYDGPLMLVDASEELPYRRPPLSKAFLAGTADRASLAFRPASFYDNLGIELILGTAAVEVDHGPRRVRLASGEHLAYEHLVLATGSRPRPWPSEGASLENVFHLSTLDDAERVRAAMRDATTLTVIGGGFIGLEAASTARDAGLDVTVLEAGPRVMARALTVTASEELTRRHRANRIDIRTNVEIDRIISDGTRAVGVLLATGEHIPTDMLLVGVGSVAATPTVRPDLRDDSGAIRVDALLRTADPGVSAIGDAAAFPWRGRRIRLESVQNATDQGRSVAARLTGKESPYSSTPWFWTEQAGIKLQMAGLHEGAEREVILGDQEGGRFSVLAFRDDALLGGESFGRAAEHIAIRRLLDSGRALSPDLAATEGFDLVAFSKNPVPTGG